MRSSLRRFTDHNDAGEPYELPWSHIAARLGVSLFREARLRSAAFSDGPVLKSGHNNRKIGAEIVKGKWKGFPVWTLTLEERATCSRSCRHWLDCYGNKMHWSPRFMADAALIERLAVEIAELQTVYNNFVIRLHVLGDFFSVSYVNQWGRWLDEFAGLHVYGYTAWQPDTEIGAAVAKLARERWDRFAVRTSNGEGDIRTTETIYSPDRSGTVSGGTVCPVQTGKTECCGTCGLCWQTQRKIVFLAH